MNEVARVSNVPDRTVGHLEVAINNAHANMTVLLATVVALEQAADRVFGPVPTPIQPGDQSAPAPCSPPLMRQLNETNDDIASVLARLDTVSNRFIALA